MEVSRERLKWMKSETVSEMLNLMEEMRQHQLTTRWSRYKPLPHQDRFHRSMARIRALIGSNRCGKTVAGMEEVLRYMRGEHPFRNVSAPCRGWIVALDNEVTRDVLFPKFLAMLRPEEASRVDYRDLVVTLKNGSLVKFKSCESGVKKFQSAENTFTWFDEEPPKDIWDECNIRIGADSPLDLWLTMTPLNGVDWSYDEIYHNQAPGEIEVFEASLNDNTYLDEKERARIYLKYKDSDEAPARLEGKYFSRSGVIYKQFSVRDHVIDPFVIPANWPVVLALDPHPRKPSAALWAAVGEDDTYYITNELNDEREELLDEFVEKVKVISGRRKIVRRLIDPAAQAKNSQTGFSPRDVMLRKGLGTVLANNNVAAGWDAVRERLSSDKGIRLKFFRTCPKTIWQMEHLAYEEWRFRGANRDQKETQRKKDDDLADCVRYICASRVHPDRPQTAYAGEPFTSYQPGKYTGY